MPRSFLDSSALIKYYHAEPGSPEMRRILGDAGTEHFISRLAWTEILSGLAKKVRTGVLAASDYAPLQHRFRADITQRLLRPIRMRNAHFERAGDLISHHGLTRQLRTLDAIQLAVALDLHRASPITHFVCADQKLCDIALLEGLTVINPEQP